MNYVKDLKKAPLQSGFYSICGCQGAGKTSLAVGLLRTDYRRWRKWRAAQGKALAKDYEKLNGIKLDVSDNLYFSNIPILLDRRRGIYTHFTDLQFLGLPNDLYEVQYFPRGSVVFVQEADVLAYARNWQDLSEYLRDLIKYVRHNLMTIIFDLQVGGDLDKALRNLTCGTFYILNSGIQRFLLFWKRQCWKFFYVRPQLNAFVKELSQLGVKANIPVGEWGKFHVRGNVFDCYDSFSGQSYFLKGIEKVGYVYKEHAKTDLSVKSINEYCKQHPLERPDETKKRSTKKQLKVAGMQCCSGF